MADRSHVLIYGLLICTLISENQGLEKSRPVSNLRKISGPANLDFFSRSPPSTVQKDSNDPPSEIFRELGT